jgi:hypothetical protein
MAKKGITHSRNLVKKPTQIKHILGTNHENVFERNTEKHEET